jgi:hypothetical protein
LSPILVNFVDFIHFQGIKKARLKNQNHIENGFYTKLISFKENDFTARVAHSEEESCQLTETGSSSFVASRETKSSENENDV